METYSYRTVPLTRWEKLVNFFRRIFRRPTIGEKILLFREK
jgi:hypothetical protein